MGELRDDGLRNLRRGAPMRGEGESQLIMLGGQGIAYGGAGETPGEMGIEARAVLRGQLVVEFGVDEVLRFFAGHGFL